MEEKNITRSCIDCHVVKCRRGDDGQGVYPDFCLTTHTDAATKDRAMAALMSEEENRIAVAAAEVEAEGYGRRTRVEEIIQFAHKIGAKKLGIATCAGLLAESRTLAKILRANDFEVVGAACKLGATPKVEIGIPAYCESSGVNMCNPVLQAEIMNDAATDLNLIVGLCVGHDSLFIKHSKALVTSVVTKDRVLGHNPCVALYQADKYYKRLLEKQEWEESRTI
ncbi:MAG: DUF1847 domain-containing protein [Peptococcaceae bacterium]|nr:DUF1847 domain-containing protein [Peptococcaceae bacterium]